MNTVNYGFVLIYRRGDNMSDLETRIKSKIQRLDKILTEYESLNRETLCNYIESEKALERELILLEELINNIDSSDKWIKQLETDKAHAGIK